MQPGARSDGVANQPARIRLGLGFRARLGAWVSDAPGSVTEKLYLFAAEYDPTMRGGKGGGLADEGEDIEVLELAFDDAVAMMADGRICDAKTIMLLQHAQLHIFAK